VKEYVGCGAGRCTLLPLSVKELSAGGGGFFEPLYQYAEGIVAAAAAGWNGIAWTAS